MSKRNLNSVGGAIHSDLHFEGIAKTEKGITMVALVITIILMLILLGVSVTTALDGGLFGQAKQATDQYNNLQDKEEIETAYITVMDMLDTSNKTNKEIFEAIKDKLNFEDATYKISSHTMNITTKEGSVYTLLLDGTIIEGALAYLDIADGSIEIKSNEYIQGGETIEYTGKYIITGTTTENTVKITDVGTYDITIKDLNIDVSSIGSICSFNANGGYKATDCYVTITIEGENKLYGGSWNAGLAFSDANPNVDGITNGSTLTIQGNGKLEVKGGNNACGIGSGWNRSANNIIINGGNITAIASNRSGIGACSNQTGKGILENLTINGGNIYVTGGEYGGAIGGTEGSKNITINGGYIYAVTNYSYSYRNILCIGTLV